jgi:dTDP-glucose 4,6-dehydratase
LNTCLVTGAAGFIGSHLVEDLVRTGLNVRALVRYTSSGFRGMLDRLDRQVLDSVEVIYGDIRDSGQMDAVTRGCDTVYHLAALIGIPYSYSAPRSYVEVNVSGTQNLLDAVRRHASGKVVMASTSEVYGSAMYTPIDEAHPLHPQSPYAASKVAADQLGLSYQRSFDTPVTLVRPFNTFGPRQSYRAVIPTIIGQALSRDDGWIELGALSPRRDFVYVADTARGFRLAADSDAAVGQVVNLASGRSISVGDLAERILDLTDRPELRVESNHERIRPPDSEVDELLGEATRARDLFGWEPEVSLDDGLQMAIEDFRQYEMDDPGRYRQ